MSNNVAISEILELFNISLSNLEAGLVMVEYSAANDMPISPLAKITIQESCDDIKIASELLSNIIGE